MQTGYWSITAALMMAMAMAQELGVLHLRLEGMREKCLVEELPANTVALGISFK